MRIEPYYTSIEMRHPNYKLSLQSKPENILLIESFVDKLCTQHAMTEEQHFNLLLVLTEAVNNAIIHGNQSDPNKMVHVLVMEQQNSFVLYVEDEGKGFNPQCVPDPTSPQYKELPNGRGLYLIQQLAEEVHYHNNGQQVEIHFELNPQNLSA